MNLDEGVPAHRASRRLDALARAQTPYDLLVLSNRLYSPGLDGYTINRMWDHLINDLMRRDPVFYAIVVTSRILFGAVTA
jgi:hypothetical protein